MTGCFNYATTNSTCSRNFWNRCSCTRMCHVVWHICWRKVSMSTTFQLRRVGFWFDNSMFSNLRTWWELVQTLSGRHHARAALPAKSTRDKWRTCRTPAKGLAVTCTMLSQWTTSKCSVRDGAYSEHTRKCFINICPFSWLWFDSAKSQDSPWDHCNWFPIGVPYHHSSAVESKVSKICKIMAIMAGHRERARPKSSPEPLP